MQARQDQSLLTYRLQSSRKLLDEVEAERIAASEESAELYQQLNAVNEKVNND